tara:strand:- start:737 stop:1537 length:801 start_codon:yes stop_codon:yes gene_type:complete
MSKALVEDLGDGNWLIKPTGEIKKCSRSTAYRHARKAEEAIEGENYEHDTVMDMPDIQEEPLDLQTIESIEEEVQTEIMDGSNELESPLEDESFASSGEEGGTPIFDLPTLEDLNGGGGDGGDEASTFQGEERDQAFIEGLKNAEIIEDVEGNRKVRIGDILIGNNPLILSMLRTCDHSLHGWAQNKHGIELWNEDSRNVQRAFFVKMLGMVSPKMSVELDPQWIILGMIGWLYGFPMLKILRVRKKSKPKGNRFEDQKPVVVLDE